MRIWTLHPKYLDRPGLIALWRESLLAQKVLQGNTKGYRNHPQLNRFKQHRNPLAAIAAYLHDVHEEAQKRAYHFDKEKINKVSLPSVDQIPATYGQLRYEWEHLKMKLYIRDNLRYITLLNIIHPEPHPLFTLIEGGVEQWEVIRKSQ